LKRHRIILDLGLAFIILLGIPYWCHAEPGKKTHSSEMSVRARPPLLKITPRPDGKFLLEPLTAPPKALPIPPSRPVQRGERSVRPTSPTSMDAPCDVSQLVLSKVRRARYAWGASLEKGSATDCSGFTQFIYRACGITLPRSSSEQAQVGQEVTRRIDFSKLQAGDLLFFREGKRSVGHAGIYLGEGKMVHATCNAGGVVVSELDQDYYVNNFVVAKRVFEKRYKWADFPGLSPAARNRDWDSPVLTPSPPPRPLPPPLPKPLLKMFWPWECQSFKPCA